MKFHVRFAAVLAADFDIQPAKVFADPGPERFRDRFLGGETRRDKRPRIFVGEAIFGFARKENPAKETFPEFLVRGANPADLDDVRTNPEDHGTEPYACIATSISLTASASPTVIARLTMLCPMFSSTRCGTGKRPERFW